MVKGLAPGARGGRRESVQATVYQNIGLCEAVRRRIGADACPMPECYGEVLGATRGTELKHRSMAAVTITVLR